MLYQRSMSREGVRSASLLLFVVGVFLFGLAGGASAGPSLNGGAQYCLTGDGSGTPWSFEVVDRNGDLLFGAGPISSTGNQSVLTDFFVQEINDAAAAEAALGGTPLKIVAAAVTPAPTSCGSASSFTLVRLDNAVLAPVNLEIDGNKVTPAGVSFNPSISKYVPEPSMTLLLLSGVLGMAIRGKRQSCSRSTRAV